ncbi:MAG TPA: hypothetical protein VN950_16820 [Terriglobales bacterium]|nr:hypothetical protein [Terriglobales bacterium]
MKSVFVAGSRAVSRLNSQVKERLDNIMKQNLAVLVGDANGADKAVQRYLAKCHYQNVVVYSMDVCRNNVGCWPTRRHTAPPEARRDRHYYGIKDLAMAKNATCGFMLWDGVSKGTLTNVINLLNFGKKTLLYLSPKKLFFKLHTYEDFQHALHANGIDNVSGFLASSGIRVSVSEVLPLATLG